MLVVMTNETSIKATRLLRSSLLRVSEVESSRTHFQVLGLGLEAYKSSKIALSSAKDSTIFWIIKILLENARNLAENLRRPFFRDRLKKFLITFFFFFLRTLALVSLVLGLEHICPWPREGLSSEGLSLALASDFLCPWPRALCLRLHFWWLWLHRKNARIKFITKMRACIVCFTLNCRTLVVLWLGMKISFRNCGIALRFCWIKKRCGSCVVLLKIWYLW